MSVRNVAIYLFDDVEVLDFAGPFEVFSVASRTALQYFTGQPPFKVFTVSKTGAAVTARGALRIDVDWRLTEHPGVDVLIVPGGVVSREADDRKVVDWIAETAAQCEICASVCTGVFLLGQAGLLDGLSVTTHWEDVDALRRALPDSRVRDDLRWVDEGRVVTSAGISAGIDMSLHLVSRLVSPELARMAARQMDYRWQSRP